MYKLEGIIKVEINSKVIYCNNLNNNYIGAPNKDEITSQKSSDNYISYSYIKTEKEKSHGKWLYKEEK